MADDKASVDSIFTVGGELPSSSNFKLCHPAGVWVQFTFRPGADVDAQVKLTGEAIEKALAAGWLIAEPSLEEGERVEPIAYVVKREKYNQTDQTTTPVVDLYPVNGKFRVLSVYLNGGLDIRAFETATGLRLNDMPLYEADNSIERGKGPKTDKFVVTLGKQAKIVWKANPKWEGDEDKKHQKRVFVRWADAPGVEFVDTATSGAYTSESLKAAVVAKCVEAGGTESDAGTWLTSYIKHLGVTSLKEVVETASADELNGAMDKIGAWIAGRSKGKK